MNGGKERPESPTLALTFALVARGSAYKLADSNNKRRNKSGRKALIASDWGGILLINFIAYELTAVRQKNTSIYNYYNI